MKSYLGNNNDSERKLVTIQKISDVLPIKDADNIELVLIEGWQCVSKKGEFNPGDKCVYFEIDSLLPLESQYKFLEKSSYKEGNEYNPSGYRLKTMRLRGELSQGLALPIHVIPYDLSQYDIGDDVTKVLNVVKYLKPEVTGIFGEMKGDYSKFSTKTDELRLQSNLEFLDFMKGKPYIITEKADGTSTTFEFSNNELKVYGRERQYTLTDDSTITRFMDKIDIKDKFASIVNKDKSCEGYILKGELVGPKIQSNLMNLRELKVLTFTFEKIVRGYGLRQGFNALTELSNDLDLETVKLIERGDSFNYTLDDLLEIAKGKYDNSTKHREGIVIRLDIDNMKDVNKLTRQEREFSFKVINNDYLLKEK